MECTRVRREIPLVLALELLYEVVDETVVEVLTTQVSITSDGLDLEVALFDRQERHIEGSSSKIEDEDVAPACHLLVKTICDGGCGRFVDDMENVETGYGARVLGCLML